MPEWLTFAYAQVFRLIGLLELFFPIKIKISVSGRPPTIVVTVTNKSKEIPVHIHAVRLHVGVKNFTYYLTLEPTSSVTIPPKGRTVFHLPHNDNVAGHRFLSKAIPIDDPTQPPPFEGVQGLLKMFVKASPKDSWIELDFNEFEERRFLVGRIRFIVNALIESIKKGPPPTPAPPNRSRTRLLLPEGIEIELEEQDLTLGELIALSQHTLHDSRLTPEGFGVLKDYFFVNSSTGSLIDSILDMRRPLSTLCINAGDVIELRFRQPDPLSDGTILNPMRGVTKYVK